MGDAAFASQSVTGLILCQAASNRFAFPAQHVSTIETWRPGGGAPHASNVFDVEGHRGKIIRHASGAGVGVDAVEVHGEDVSLLPAPRVIAASTGGSLYGFAAVDDKLYPVLRLSEFAHFLQHREGANP